MRLFFLLLMVFVPALAGAQILNLPKRKSIALNGKAFALSICDKNLKDREESIYQEIKKGNVPDFLRKLVKISDSIENLSVSYYVLPDYLSIGSNQDFFYVPMTPSLAQKVARLTGCSLPTKKIVNQIYRHATIKLSPQPIPPTNAMTTIPVFIGHTDSIMEQLKPVIYNQRLGELVAGNKKDVIISNKIYGEKSPRVVIYGWHKLDGKPIQPLYNKHGSNWADYSHGVRLIQNIICINQKKTSLKKVLRDVKLSNVFSDEGIIRKSYYPILKDANSH